jgi:hypothetical protein
MSPYRHQSLNRSEYTRTSLLLRAYLYDIVSSEDGMFVDSVILLAMFYPDTCPMLRTTTYNCCKPQAGFYVPQPGDQSRWILSTSFECLLLV